MTNPPPTMTDVIKCAKRIPLITWGFALLGWFLATVLAIMVSG